MEQRSEHLNWCKKRAMEYLDMNDQDQAFVSFISDLTKWEQNTNEWDTVIQLGMMLSIGGHLTTKKQIKDFIHGTN